MKLGCLYVLLKRTRRMVSKLCISLRLIRKKFELVRLFSLIRGGLCSSLIGHS